MGAKVHGGPSIADPLTRLRAHQLRLALCTPLKFATRGCGALGAGSNGMASDNEPPEITPGYNAVNGQD